MSVARAGAGGGPKDNLIFKMKMSTFADQLPLVYDAQRHEVVPAAAGALGAAGKDDADSGAGARVFNEDDFQAARAGRRWMAGGARAACCLPGTWHASTLGGAAFHALGC